MTEQVRKKKLEIFVELVYSQLDLQDEMSDEIEITLTSDTFPLNKSKK